MFIPEIVVLLPQSYKYFSKICNKSPKNVAIPVKTMKKYLANLLCSLSGHNPFQMELDALRERYDKTAERVEELNDLYYKSLETFDDTRKQMLGYQKLIENLRMRICEYADQIETARKENNRLKRLLRQKDREQENV